MTLPVKREQLATKGKITVDIGTQQTDMIGCLCLEDFLICFVGGHGFLYRDLQQSIFLLKRIRAKIPRAQSPQIQEDSQEDPSRT